MYWGVLLVLTITWATNTSLTCLEGMEPLMGCTDPGLSNQTAPILAGLNGLTLLLADRGLQICLINLGYYDYHTLLMK